MFLTLQVLSHFTVLCKTTFKTTKLQVNLLAFKDQPLQVYFSSLVPTFVPQCCRWSEKQPTALYLDRQGKTLSVCMFSIA